MKYFLMVLMFVLLSAPLLADSGGIFYDPDRNGEGAVVFTREGQVAFLVFTYDEAMGAPCAIVPIPQPSPRGHNWGRRCENNLAVWYSGTAEWDGVEGSGELLLGTAVKYPFADEQGSIHTLKSVGTFTILKTATGYLMMVEATEVTVDRDPYIDLFSHDFNWNTLLIGD